MPDGFLPVSQPIVFVCKGCGKSDGLHLRGAAEVDAWRNAKIQYDPVKGCIDEILTEVEMEFHPHCHPMDFRPENYACSECGLESAKIGDMVASPFGEDSLGRLLDAEGNPHGAAKVPPEQERLEL